MTSSTRREMAMLSVRRRSSTTGGTGRISKRMVPKMPRINQRSPCFRSKPMFDFVLPILALYLFAVIAIAIDPIDPGQYFRHRGKELSRNLATHPAMLEEQAGQGFILHDRHVMLGRYF